MGTTTRDIGAHSTSGFDSVELREDVCPSGKDGNQISSYKQVESVEPRHCKESVTKLVIDQTRLRQRALNGVRAKELLSAPFDVDTFHLMRLPPEVGLRAQAAGKATDWRGQEEQSRRLITNGPASSSASMAGRLGREIDSKGIISYDRSGRRCRFAARAPHTGLQIKELFATQNGHPASAGASEPTECVTYSRSGCGKECKKHFPEKWEEDNVNFILNADANEMQSRGNICTSRKGRRHEAHDSKQVYNLLTNAHVGEEVAAVKRLSKGNPSIISSSNPYRWGVDVLNYQLPPCRALTAKAFEDQLDMTLLPRHSTDEYDHCAVRRWTGRYQKDCLQRSTLVPLESSAFTKSPTHAWKSLQTASRVYEPLSGFQSGQDTGKEDVSNALPAALSCIGHHRRLGYTKQSHLQRDLTPAAEKKTCLGRRVSKLRCLSHLQLGTLCPQELGRRAATVF